MHSVRIPSRLAGLSGFGALLLSTPLLAQAPVWVPLNPNSQPGEPARIELLPSSTFGRSVFRIRLSGFWREAHVWHGTTYQRIRVPGLDMLGQPGAPDLPVARLRLAVPTTPLGQPVSFTATVAASMSFANTLVEPCLVPALDGEAIDPSRNPGPGATNGTPERWRIDRSIYSSASTFPGRTVPTSMQVEKRFGPVPMLTVEVSPFQFDAPSGRLYVATEVGVFCDAPGPVQSFLPMTRDRAQLCAASFHNWPTVGGAFAVDDTTYNGRYLIVTKEDYLPAIQAFVDHRKACGFGVTVLTTQQTGAGSANIRAAIDAWYSATPFHYDHYCLLVGDTDVIPLAPVAGQPGLVSDDPYGSPGDGDLDEEVFVGRISADDANDVAISLQKIIQYETNPILGGDYDQALLVAHEEGAPGKYEGAHEAVANAVYAVPPTFLKRYGSSAASTNASVQAAIDAQVGLVAYRGHGSTSTWSGWNVAGESFHKNDVVAMNNGLRPVVWSFSCTNNNLAAFAGTETDSIGEAWVETPFGAVAHYGALDVSGTAQNHVLDWEMFHAVYHLGLTTHAFAIWRAEEAMTSNYPEGNNAWLYNLIGCPAMKIRRTVPQPPTLLGPQELTVGRRSVQIEVRNAQGIEMPNVLVSSYSLSGHGSEARQVNGYTDANGIVVLELEAGSPGAIRLTARDAEGNVGTAEILVRASAWTDLGDATRGSAGFPELRGTGTLQTDARTTLDLRNARSFAPTLLLASIVDQRFPFVGGILHTSATPLMLPAQTTPTGMVTFFDHAWPGAPMGTELFFQALVLDSTANGGIALSNALRALQP
ncbi:MAG: hypothetical protein JNM84_08060 [Planctomycetes bacterium]|nr:hypothetical protein [Planctomycetota bacterium]